MGGIFHVTYKSPDGIPEYSWLRRVVVYIIFTITAQIAICFFCYFSPLFRPYSNGESFFKGLKVVPKSSRFTILLMLFVVAVYFGWYFLGRGFNIRRIEIDDEGITFYNYPYEVKPIEFSKKYLHFGWDEISVERESDQSLSISKKNLTGQNTRKLIVMRAKHYENEYASLLDELKIRGLIKE